MSVLGLGDNALSFIYCMLLQTYLLQIMHIP
jgi:hypothetical protein